MRVRQVWLGAAALVAAGVLAGCGGGGDEPAAAPTAAAAGERPGQAQTVVDAIAAKWPLPNPEDNTSACAGKEGAADGCVQLITTDAVSVYEYADAATAKRWVTEMKKQGDWRQAGRFALAWTARDQDMTDKDARADMVKIATQAGAKL
ncbi:hypothetical protein [Actinoplanes sp. NPDC048796]|uniref:hypothetical protein n=1 Tax=Actinoplanes sp. NPDC048796 TaxID=3155640 RepID=UPI0033E900C3